MSFLWYWPAGGWDFDRWKKDHPWEPIKSEQSGKKELIPLIAKNATRADWESAAKKWRGTSDALLGNLNDKPPAKFKWEWLGEELTREKSPTYTMRRLRYRLTDDEWGYAWLLVPRDVKGKTATIIAHHQTHPHGKSEPVGLEDIPENAERGLRYGADLAERGFIVLVPDAIAFGERQSGHQNTKYRSADQFFSAHPQGSVMRKMAYDTSRAIDLLEQLPNVDSSRIGCIGHSHGAYGTLFAMLADERIKAGVISCGMSLLRADPNPHRWWRLTALIPRLGYYEGKMDETPLDFHVWLALLAPRPVMVIAGTRDTIFPKGDELRGALDRAREVYDLYNAGDKLHSAIFEGPHDFPRKHRETAYAMLEHELKSKSTESAAVRATVLAAGAATTTAAPTPSTKTFRVPDTRLPFINGEIAQVQFQGQPHLVSGVWAANAGGRIYFWDPVNKTQAARRLPPGSPGAYMIKTGPNGILYLGDGKGTLHRYDPSTDTFDTLAAGQLKGITWGGCVTDRHVVWTTDPGNACAYDWQRGRVHKTFAPVDTLQPPAHYGHNVVEAPDAKIILFMDTPQLHLCVMDWQADTVQSVMPDSIVGHATALHATFFDAGTMLLVTNDPVRGFQFLSYPDFKLIEIVEPPQGYKPTYGRGRRLGEHYYAVFGPPAGSLWRISNKNRKWERVIEGWLGEETGYLGAFNGSHVCAVTVTGRALSWEVATGQRDEMQIDNLGQMDAHALCIVPERELIIGAPFINARFWTIDMNTGKGGDRGRGMPGAGQINHIVWDAGRHRALMSAYAAAALTEYDPSKDAKWPENPRLVATAEHEQQMRPRALVFDRRYAWMATSPAYGRLGGALSRIDPETSEIKAWRNIVPDQTINALALDPARRRIYLSSEIYGDMDSAPPTQTTAQLVAFDMDKLEVIKRQVVRDGAPKMAVTCVLPDGRVLGHEGNQYFAWDVDRGTVQPLGAMPSAGPVLVDQRGELWGAFGGSIGRVKIDEKSMQFTPLIPQPGTLLQLEDEVLYYVAPTTNRQDEQGTVYYPALIYATPLEELRSK